LQYRNTSPRGKGRVDRADDAPRVKGSAHEGNALACKTISRGLTHIELKTVPVARSPGLLTASIERQGRAGKVEKSKSPMAVYDPGVRDVQKRI